MTEERKGRVDQTGWLVAHGLAKSFGKLAVVRNVSLAVRRGEAVGCSARTAPARPRFSP